mmetsp:Transcript_17768/g.33968  ORF Transcript_17768/g.33968 Transcript_17768/m.33968 type:complete len:219 (-) Transcript_17768:959-1615(-)
MADSSAGGSRPCSKAMLNTSTMDLPLAGTVASGLISSSAAAIKLRRRPSSGLMPPLKQYPNTRKGGVAAWRASPRDSLLWESAHSSTVTSASGCARSRPATMVKVSSGSTAAGKARSGSAKLTLGWNKLRPGASFARRLSHALACERAAAGLAWGAGRAAISRCWRSRMSWRRASRRDSRSMSRCLAAASAACLSWALTWPERDRLDATSAGSGGSSL